MGTTMGRLPCSLEQGMEVEAVVEDSVTPFLDAGKDAELLARSGEPSPLSVEGGIFGNKFSKMRKNEQSTTSLRKMLEIMWPYIFFYHFFTKNRAFAYFSLLDCFNSFTLFLLNSLLNP